MVRSFYCVHDTETGGLSEEENPITQYACVILEPKNLTEVARWETFIQPYHGLKVEQDALNHTMVSMTDIRGGIKLKDFVKTASVFWGQYQAKTRYADAGRLISVGHNEPFDRRFLTMACGLEDVDFNRFFHENAFDTMVAAKLVWGLVGNEKIRLSDCIVRAGLKLTDAHGAMNDVEATADLLRFFVKRMRSNRGSNTDSAINVKRGQEFFEFKCAR